MVGNILNSQVPQNNVIDVNIIQPVVQTSRQITTQPIIQTSTIPTMENNMRLTMNLQAQQQALAQTHALAEAIAQSQNQYGGSYDKKYRLYNRYNKSIKKQIGGNSNIMIDDMMINSLGQPQKMQSTQYYDSSNEILTPIIDPVPMNSEIKTLPSQPIVTTISSLPTNLGYQPDVLIREEKVFNPYVTNNVVTQSKIVKIPKLINIDSNQNISIPAVTEVIQETVLERPLEPLGEYQNEDKKEDKYLVYIKNMIKDLFTSEDVIDHEEMFEDNLVNAGMAEKLSILEAGQKDHVIKPTIKALLEKFESINKSMYLDLSKTLLYKHIIGDNKLDNISFGTQLIKKIKEILINIQKQIKFDDGRSLLDEINLFSFLRFKISGGYIIIENKNYDTLGIKRVIRRKLLPNLKVLEDQYDKPIDYKLLSNIILQNKTTLDVKNNKEIINEALNLLAQDYFICLQPKVEYLLWAVTRLLLCWYADPVLNDNIYKVKVLINLYRARGLKEFNQDIGVQPVIIIIPKYGRKAALKILSYLTYYFFPYKNVGWSTSSPSYFNKVDDLIYYTNGSIDLKKYIKHLMDNNMDIVNPMSSDFTKINLESGLNDIQYPLPIKPEENNEEENNEEENNDESNNDEANND
jgi:hypothetical protein